MERSAGRSETAGRARKTEGQPVSWGFGRLGWLIASPKFHRWYHTSEDEGLDKNLAGLFPFIDVLVGTYYMPPDRQPQQFGVCHESVPAAFVRQMIYPFHRSRA